MAEKFLISDDDPAFASMSSPDSNIGKITSIGGRLFTVDVDPAVFSTTGSNGVRNHLMRPPVEFGDLSAIAVGGTGMDYHGTGVPIPALRRLAWRRHLESESNKPDGTPPSAVPGEGVLVGLVDGAFTAHPWLEGGYLAAPDEFEPFFPAGDGSGPFRLRTFAGHATFVTGLILQQAPAAGVWVEKVLNEEGTAFADAVAAAAHTLVERGVHILNLSLGCVAQEEGFAPIMRTMVEGLFALNPELVIVAAAGNRLQTEDPAQEFLPASLGDVVAVGSVKGDVGDDLQTWADWSRHGPWVDFAANGTKLLSTYVDREVFEEGSSNGPTDYSGWANWSGTSFSCAVVSGAIARRMTTDPTRLSAQSAVDKLRSEAPTRTTDGNVPVVPRQIWDRDLENKPGIRSPELKAGKFSMNEVFAAS